MSSSIYTNPELFGSPSRLKLRQTITNSGSVVIPNGVEKVWAVVIGGGGGGDTCVNYVTPPTIVSGVAGGSITSLERGVPGDRYLTYYTTSIVPVGQTVIITGFATTSYNGTFTTTHSDPGVSFTVFNSNVSGTGVVAATGVFTNILYFTFNSMPYSVGDNINIVGAVPTTFINTFQIIAINGNTAVCRRQVSSSTPAAGTTLTTVGTVRLTFIGGGPGGGAGGFSCGWTYPSNTCVVGNGGTGGTPSSLPTQGEQSSYGTIIAGGGGAGRNARIVASSSQGLIGGGNGGAHAQISSVGVSFTGAPYVGGQTTTGNNVAGVSAVSGSGSNGNYGSTGNEITTSQTITNGGSGLIGGGAGGALTTGAITAGNGGNGYMSTGGTGASGTGYSFGGGGGGAGYLNNGGNASGPDGGNGGLGGGGGGGASGANDGGNGGKGIIHLYY